MKINDESPICKAHVVSLYDKHTKPLSMVHVLYQMHDWSLQQSWGDSHPEEHPDVFYLGHMRVVHSFLLRSGLFLSHWVFVIWQGFDEAIIKRVPHHIINWWTSKGECYKYYYLCGCPRKYSLVLSLWCKHFLYIKRLMRINNTLIFPL